MTLELMCYQGVDYLLQILDPELFLFSHPFYSAIKYFLKQILCGQKMDNR